MTGATASCLLLAGLLVGCVVVTLRGTDRPLLWWILGRWAQACVLGLLASSMGPSWQGLALLAGMAAVTGAAGWTLHGPGGERGRYLAPVWWAGTGTGTGIALWLGERVPGLEPWGPLVLLAWLALALGLEVAAGGGAPWPGRGESLGVFDAELVLALSATMTATVVGAPTVGWWFLPLVTVSLVALSSALVGRIRAVAVADETVVAAMRLPEVLGYSRPDHAQAVEGVCACLAEEIGIDAEQRETLLSAARLHDVGLVSLVRPIRGGSTSQLAPRDQQRVALRSAEIAAELHFPPPVVEVLEHQAHAYIDHVSYRADVPRPARILKVANALDDYTAGERTPEAFARAMERINRQAGYEFDPVVVSAARKVVERVTASRGGPPAAGPPSVPGPRPGGPP